MTEQLPAGTAASSDGHGGRFAVAAKAFDINQEPACEPLVTYGNGEIRRGDHEENNWQP